MARPKTPAEFVFILSHHLHYEYTEVLSVHRTLRSAQDAGTAYASLHLKTPYPRWEVDRTSPIPHEWAAEVTDMQSLGIERLEVRP